MLFDHDAFDDRACIATVCTPDDGDPDHPQRPMTCDDARRLRAAGVGTLASLEFAIHGIREGLAWAAGDLNVLVLLEDGPAVAVLARLLRECEQCRRVMDDAARTARKLTQGVPAEVVASAAESF